MNKKLVPVIGILLILGVGGYIFLQQKSSPAVNPEIKKAQQEMIANCKYDQDFCKYAANGIVAMSNGYTMTTEYTYNGKKSKMVLKSDGKENTQSTTYTDGKEAGSFVSLDKTTYMKGPGETVWTEFPASKDETGKTASTAFNFENLKKELTDASKEVADSLVVKKVGTEACGNFTCSVFEMTEKTMNTTTKIWIDTKEYLARKMESSSKMGTSTMMFEYAPVVITKPSPVKKMPTFDTSTIKNGEGSVDMEQIKRMMKDAPQQTEPSSDTPAESQ